MGCKNNCDCAKGSIESCLCSLVDRMDILEAALLNIDFQPTALQFTSSSSLLSATFADGSQKNTLIDIESSGGALKRVYVDSIIGDDLTGEIDNEAKPFETLNAAITKVLTDIGELTDYTFVFLTDGTHEIIQPIVDLKYLHLDGGLFTVETIQRTSFGLSESFILEGNGLFYKIDPDANSTALFGTAPNDLNELL